jgi:putative two-component system response regulator
VYTKENKSDLDQMLELYSSDSLMDNELRTHCKRVGYYTYVISRTMGLSEDRSEEIMYGALLHDIGKTKIPSEILGKSSKLTDGEFEIIKSHCEEGFKMIEAVVPQSNSSFKNTLLNISYHHHEKWDGKGYPMGLKGKEIPIEASIVAIGDIFDALTAERCYKKSWTIEETTNFINNQSGNILNPEVVNSFNKLKHVFSEIKNNFLINDKDIDNPKLYKNQLMDFLHSKDIELPFEEKISKENKCNNFLSEVLSKNVVENKLSSSLKR